MCHAPHFPNDPVHLNLAAAPLRVIACKCSSCTQQNSVRFVEQFLQHAFSRKPKGHVLDNLSTLSSDLAALHFVQRDQSPQPLLQISYPHSLPKLPGGTRIATGPQWVADIRRICGRGHRGPEMDGLRLEPRSQSQKPGAHDIGKFIPRSAKLKLRMLIRSHEKVICERMH